MSFSITVALLLNLTVFLSGWMLAGRLLDNNSGSGRFLATSVFSVSLIIISLQLTGISGKISIEWILAFQSAVFVIVWYFTRRKGRRNPQKTAPRKKEKPPSLSFTVISVVFFCAVLIVGSFAIIMPPAPTDAFLDHLFFPAEWLKSGSIFIVHTLSPDQATSYYPANGELAYLWLMLPLHDDLLVGLLEPVSLFIAIAAAYRIGIRAGLHHHPAAAAATAAGLSPVTFNQLHQFGIELFFAAFFLAAVSFLLPEKDTEISIPETAAAGLAAGIAAGSKYLGVIFIVLLLPLLFCGTADRKKRVASIAVFTATAFLTGAFWYLRNLFITGSPFYPLGLELFGINIFDGAYGRAAMFNSYLHVDTSSLLAFYESVIISGFGVWFVMGLSVILVVTVLKKGGGNGRTVLSATGIFVLGALLISINSSGAFDQSFGSESFRFHAMKKYPLAAALPAAILFLSMIILRIMTPGEKWFSRYAIGLGPVILIIFWYVNPYNTLNNTRFIIPGIFLIFIFSALLLEKSGWKTGWWLLVPGAVAGCWKPLGRTVNFWLDSFNSINGTGWTADAFVPALAGIIFFGLGIATVYILIKSKPARAVIPFMLFAASLGIFTALKSDHMLRHRYDWYAGHYLARSWKSLSRIKEPVSIAYSGNCAPYGLYGNMLKNRVVYVNTDGRSGFAFHDYEKESRGRTPAPRLQSSVGLNHVFRGNGSFESWYAGLREERINLLVVSREIDFGQKLREEEIKAAEQESLPTGIPPNSFLPQETLWALGHPDKFRLLDRAGDTLIFSIIN
ncbi:MAG TPA: hypothetical protein PLN69_10785 [bacterium]|nr:hypothetical protein [bacterium]